MVKSTLEPGFGGVRNSNQQQPSPGPTPDFSLALVVGKSPVNRVVVSKIVERSGLKPIAETPAAAVGALPLLFPAIIILDGGADNKDCDGLIPAILALRRSSGNQLPAVILLSARAGSPEAPDLSGIIDAVVTKPFTTDHLQPVVERMLERARK